MRACKDCRHYRIGWFSKILGQASYEARCMAAEPDYDKVTGETILPQSRCWVMRLPGEACGPDAKLWGPF